MLPSSTNPDASVHRQHARRASRHADGLPSPRQEHSRGRGVCREPHSRRDDCRRGRAARSRRHQHDVERQSGDGTRRRGDHAGPGRRRTRCAASAAGWPGESGEQRQPAHPALHREVHDQPGDHARHRARGRLGRGRQARRPRAVEAGVLRRQAGAGAEGRLHRLGADGRSERVDSDAAAGDDAADVRRLRPGDRRDVAGVRLAAVARDGGAVDRLRADQARRGGSRLPRPSPSAT